MSWPPRLMPIGFDHIALSPAGAVDVKNIERSDRMALYLGTEGEGLPGRLLNRLKTVRISMAPGFRQPECCRRIGNRTSPIERSLTRNPLRRSVARRLLLKRTHPIGKTGHRSIPQTRCRMRPRRLGQRLVDRRIRPFRSSRQTDNFSRQFTGSARAGSRLPPRRWPHALRSVRIAHCLFPAPRRSIGAQGDRAPQPTRANMSSFASRFPACRCGGLEPVRHCSLRGRFGWPGGRYVTPAR